MFLGAHCGIFLVLGGFLATLSFGTFWGKDPQDSLRESLLDSGERALPGSLFPPRGAHGGLQLEELEGNMGGKGASVIQSILHESMNNFRWGPRCQNASLK